MSGRRVCRRWEAARRRRRGRTAARISLPAASIGGPPKNCARASPLASLGCVVEASPRAVVVAARAEEHRAGAAPPPQRGTDVARRGRRVGRHRGEPILRPWPPAVSPMGSRWWSTACRSTCADDGVVAARRAARPSRPPLPQGRLQPAGPVRMLHGAGRRSAPGRLRDPGPASAGRAITTVDGLPADVRDRVGRRVLRHRRQPVRVLHPGHRVPPRGPAGQGTGCRPRRRRAGAARPPLPLHRLAHDPRRLGRSPPTAARRSRPRPRRPPAARAAPRGRAGRSVVAPAVALGQGGFADDTAPPDALVAVPDGAGGWAVGETLAEARPSPARCRVGAPPSTPARPSTCRRATGRRPLRTSLGRARLPRARRVVVRAGRRAAYAPGQRRRLRRQAPLASPATRRARWPTSTAGRCGCCLNREDVVRLGPKRPPVAGGCRRRRHGVAAGRAHAGHRRSDRVGGARPRGRGGRRAGAPDLGAPARGRLGRGDRAARRRPRHRSAR